ncbi:MAG: TonB-dependent receptor [Acidobacteria bacterium]|nr:MAG: TonB-dependent receptor [Acidobacteriota bacterium]
MRHHSKIILTGLVLSLLALAGTLCAQTTKGTIAGVVTDAQGLVVPGASVTASAIELGEARSTTTGAQGEYRIEALTLGKYTLAVKASGFAETVVRDVVVNASLITATNVELKIAGGIETVTVEAGAETIQTESGELSKTIPQVDVKDLPYSSLNPYQLAVTLPGVSTVASRDDSTNGTSFTVNGLRPRANNFLIDGFDNNDNGIMGQAYQPQNTEAVQEVTFLTNAYAAEFGRGGASVSNLTFRSGSNAFHGAAWEQYKGASLNALSAEDRLGELKTPAQFVENIFGFRFGGPVIKNKLFFFATSQWDHFHGVPTVPTLSLPTAAGFATLQALNNTNGNLMLAALGNIQAPSSQGTIPIGARTACPATAVDPVSGQCQVDWGYFRRNDIGKNLSREWTARADYNLTNDSVFVRYTDSYNSSSPDLFANPNALPYADTQQSGPSRIFGLMWAHTFSPTVLNELRFSAQQIDFTFGPTAATEANPMAHLPTLYLDSGTLDFNWGGYEQGSFPQGRGHKNFQFQDAVSWTRGTHTMKLGADLAVLLVQDQFPFNSDGLIFFGAGGTCGTETTYTCSALENYLDNYLGTGGTASRSFGNPRQSVPTNQQAYYFQDSWKFHSNLTLDFGVRYEYQPPDASNVLAYPALSRQNIGSAVFPLRTLVQSDRNNFGPRLGFAYTPKFWTSVFGQDKTVIRGGWGMFYDAFFTNISDNTAGASPNATGKSITAGSTPGRGLSDPLTAVATATATPSPFTSVTSVDRNLRNPLIHQWNLNIQRELPARLKAEVAYVGTRGERLWVNEQLNPRVEGDARIYTNRGSLVIRGNRADSIYHGLQTGSDVFVTSGGASRWQNVFDPRSDRGPSAFNRTHRAVISYTYEVPFKNNGLLKYIADGWFTSGVISFQSGTPETIYLGGYDQNGDGEAYNDRPNWGNPKAPLNYSSACNSWGSGCITGIGQDDGSGQLVDWNTGAPGNLSQFRYIVTLNPVYGGTKFVNGNVSRNNFTYPGRQDWNLSLGKRFMMPYKEGHLIELRMDMFNAFNHANLGVNNLNGDINSANFLNQPLTASGGRTVTLWAKYSF